LLLSPSLWWVQRYRGLTEYVRNGLEMSRNEAERTRIGWPRFMLDGKVSSIVEGDNAEASIYYVFLCVPALVLAVTAWKTRRGATDRERTDAPVAVLVAL